MAVTMDRRDLLKGAVAIPALAGWADPQPKAPTGKFNGIRRLRPLSHLYTQPAVDEGLRRGTPLLARFLPLRHRQLPPAFRQHPPQAAAFRSRPRRRSRSPLPR